MLLNNGDTYTPEDADIIAWEKAYPAINVYQELNAMESWLDANPTRRKTPKGIKRFVNSWLLERRTRVARHRLRLGLPVARVST